MQPSICPSASSHPSTTAARPRSSSWLALTLPLLLAVACHPGGAATATGNEPTITHEVVDPTLPPPLDAQGWSIFTPNALNTRIVYVSSSTGNDSNSGLSPALPRRTIAAGKALIRNGFPDWLLLKKGDAWDESVGNWPTVGSSLGEPQLLGSYGTGARPLVRSGASQGMLGSGGGSRRWLAVVGIHFRGRDNAPTSAPSGISFLTPVEGFLIEDCLVERYQVGIVIDGFDGRFRDVRLRRNIVVDNYSVSTTHAGGTYLSRIDGLLLEENVFDHNGWLPSVTNATGPTIHRHNIYIQSDCTGCILHNNFVMNAASHGAQMRSAGIAIGNVFVRNSISLLMSGNTVSGSAIEAICHDNVFLEGKDIDAANPRGWALEAQNVQGGIFSNNLFANATQANLPFAMQFKDTMRDVSIVGNMCHNWPRGISFEGNNTTFGNFLLQGNHIQDLATGNYLIRHYDSQTPSYIASSSYNTFNSSILSPGQWLVRGSTGLDVNSWRNQFGDNSSLMRHRTMIDATRSLGSYEAALGGPNDFNAFRQQLRLQSKDYWRPQYTAVAAAAWIRQGYGM
jgi:hypothetical protein